MEFQNVADLNGEQVSKLTQKELKEIVKTLNTRIRGRLRNLKGEKTPATEAFNKRGGLKSVRKMNLNQLRNYYVSQSSFLKAKTSTVKGLKQYNAEFYQRTGYDPAKKEDFWKVYNEYMDKYPHSAYQVSSDARFKIETAILQSNRGATLPQLMKLMDKAIDKAAENFRVYGSYDIPDEEEYLSEDDFDDYFGGF